jgi:hypothetical protein
MAGGPSRTRRRRQQPVQYARRVHRARHQPARCLKPYSLLTAYRDLNEARRIFERVANYVEQRRIARQSAKDTDLSMPMARLIMIGAASSN